MRWFIVSFILLLFACNKKSADSYGLKIYALISDGLSRRYAVYIPVKLQHNPPVIFVLHGGGGTIEDITGQTGRRSPHKLWMQLADQYGFLVVYPEAYPNSEGKNTWNDCRADCQVCSSADDVKFITQVIDTLKAVFNIDTNNLFFYGVSNGGFMTYRLASQLKYKIRAIAVIISSLPAKPECNLPSYPIAVFILNGTADPLIPYNGGIVANDPVHGTCKGVEQTVNYWINLNRTDTGALIYHFPDLTDKDSSRVTKYVYQSTNGFPVVFYKVEGGGHATPSINQQYSALYELLVGKQNHDIETVYQVWDFFNNIKNKR